MVQDGFRKMDVEFAEIQQVGDVVEDLPERPEQIRHFMPVVPHVVSRHKHKVRGPAWWGSQCAPIVNFRPPG